MKNWKLNSRQTTDTLASMAVSIVLRLLMGICVLAYETELAAAETAQGLRNPTLSFNLAEASDYSPGLQFLNLMKMMRPWMGHEAGQWNNMSTDELRDGGYLDADGWITEIPNGLDSIGTIWSWGDINGVSSVEGGTFVLDYEGEGTIEVIGRVNIISEENGRIVFENDGTESFQVRIFETDPNGTGDYIRDISIVREEYLDMFEAGAVFNPDWLALIENSRELRFMNWMETNNSEMTSWSEMQSVNGPNAGNGVSIEDMVRLANETGTDPWFTIPHLADDEYIRNFAEYVRDNLDPNLTVRVEYSNEAWNFAFDQTAWLRDQAAAEWGPSTSGYIDYHAKKAVETALIWDDVFSSPADSDRLINVMGTLAVNPWQSDRLLNPVMWAEMEPENYVDPSTVFDELATTTYFGVSTMSHAELRDELIAVIENPNIDAAAWLADRLMDPSYSNSIPQVAEYLRQTANVAHQYGLDLVSYEGGQHIHHSFAVSGLTQADINTLNDFMFDFVRSDEMAGLYEELWAAWEEHGDGAFMQFTDVFQPSQWGSWGLYSDLTDMTPRAQVLEALNDSTSPWWSGAVGGEFRQQGVVTNGNGTSQTLIGTSQEDYLSGRGGNDTIVAGGGNDGINGGNGIDRAVFSGSANDYTIRIEGDGYRVDGLDGSDFIINIEELAFEAGELLVIEDLTVNSDGTLQIPGNPEPIDPKGPLVPKCHTSMETGKVFDANGLTTVRLDAGIDGPLGLTIEAIAAGSEWVDVFSVAKGTAAYMVIAGCDDTLEGSGIEHLEIHEGAIVINSPLIVASDFDDTFVGQGADDFVFAGDGDDSLSGGDGDDDLHGGAGEDIIYGDIGDDEINGGRNADQMFGGRGWDKISGGKGADQLFGEDGKDNLYGGDGADVLTGGNGDDILNGGTGTDTFVFSKGSGRDVIQDFSENDTLVFNDFLRNAADASEVASIVDGNLTLSSGSDEITLVGLRMGDLDWVLDNVA